MAEAAGLALAVLGLLPPLIQVCTEIRKVCAGIALHEEGCALLVEQVTYLQATVTAAVEGAAKSGANVEGLREDVEHLTATLRGVTSDLESVRTYDGNYFKRFLRSRRAGEELCHAREKIQSTISGFTAISTTRLHEWMAKEGEARRKDQEDSIKYLQAILRMLEDHKTDIRTVMTTLLPRAMQEIASERQIERAKAEGSKAAAAFAKELEALRPPPSDPTYMIFQSVVNLAMKLFLNGEAIPDGHQLPGDFFDDMPRRSNVLDVRVKDLETGKILDDEILLRHHHTYEHLVHALLLTSRGPPYQPLKTPYIHLYVREEKAHRLTPRGLFWTPVKKRGHVVDILPRPRRLGGWCEIELVCEDQQFLIALVDEGGEEKGAVLEFKKEGTVATMIRAKWPYRQPVECLGLDAAKRGYVIQLADACQHHSLDPYQFGLCVRFSDGKGHVQADTTTPMDTT